MFLFGGAGWGVDVNRRKERDARAAEAGDRIVEVTKPLGCVMEADNKGDVFITEVFPGSNAAKAGNKIGPLISTIKMP